MGKIIGFEEISVSASPVSLSPSVYVPAQGPAAAKAFVTAEGGEMRYRIDGQDPTAATGHLLVDSNLLKLEDIYSIRNFRVIQSSVDAGKLTVSYEG